MIKQVRKAVFPAAGLGTRFLPATKAIPKAMLTIIDRPLIQYAVDEARAAGIEHFVFVTGPKGRAIEEHFAVAAERESSLGHRGGTTAVTEPTRDLHAEASFAQQPAPLGLGHAVWCARHLVGEEPFAVLLPDFVTRGEPGCLAQILETYYLTGGNVVSIEECRPDQTSKYGIVARGERISEAAFRVEALVEKPSPETAPSNLRIRGRYVLQPEIFQHLSRHSLGVGGEIQLTDAMMGLAGEQPIFGHRFRGRSFDCGSKEGFIAANVAFALDDPRLAPIVQREIDVISGGPGGPAPN